MDPFVMWATFWALGWCGLFTHWVMTGLGFIGLAGLQLQPLLETVKPEHQKTRWLFWDEVNDVANLAIMLGWVMFLETVPIYGWVIGLSIATRAACHLCIVPTLDVPSFLEDKAGLFLVWVWLVCEFHYVWLLFVAITAYIHYVPQSLKLSLWLVMIMAVNAHILGFGLFYYLIGLSPLTHQDCLAVTLLNSATVLVVGLNRPYFFS